MGVWTTVWMAGMACAVARSGASETAPSLLNNLPQEATATTRRPTTAVFHANARDVQKNLQVNAAQALVVRVVGEAAATFFTVELLSPSACTGTPRLCFEYKGIAEGKVRL
jgi:hypothetical protein